LHAQDTAKLAEELQVLASAPSPLIAAQERRAERAADTGKFEKLIENLVVSITLVLAGLIIHADVKCST
jgi:hypothetical protein